MECGLRRPGQLLAEYQKGGGTKWRSEDFVQIDRSMRLKDRHYETNDCWYPADGLALRPFKDKWASSPTYSAVATGGYFYFSCIYAAFQWQYSVFVYDVASGAGHKEAIEALGYPTLVAPYGLALGP